MFRPPWCRPAAIAALCLVWGTAQAAPAATADASAICREVAQAPTVQLPLGKSTLLRPPAPVSRVVMGQALGAEPATGAGTRPGVAELDVLLLGPGEIYLMAKSLGTANVMLAGRDGRCTTFDVVVGLDVTALQGVLQQLLPDEKDVKVTAAFDSIVLSGTVSDTEALTRVTDLAGAYVRNQTAHRQAGALTVNAAGTTARIINLLAVGAPQQVMLEVKVAEVSKALIDKLGVQFRGSRAPNGNFTYNLLANFLSGSSGAIGVVGSTASSTFAVTVDAQKDDSLVKVLAEPTIMAVSGQTGSFLAGGKIFIPVAQTSTNGQREITLEEKTFGVSVSFTPTVLGAGRINLRVKPEVSELNKEGITLTSSSTNGTAILPSFTSRMAETTVQLMDGQSFAIGGLIKNNTTTNIKAFPFLGELPVIGALFRSSQFQTDRTELVFVVTPRLVKPLPADYRLPTDGYVPPSRSDLILEGRTEGERSRQPAPAAPPGGFDLPAPKE